MKMSLKRLCRLCGLKDELLKELLDESNKSVLNLIKDFIHITVDKNNLLPTLICLNCEEKMISFQLFILECHKTQEYLYDLCSRSNMTDHVDIEARCKQNFTIKPEVKDEITEEDIVNAINNDHSLEVLDDHNYLGDDHFDDDDDEDMDNITIATLKQMKTKSKSSPDSEQFDQVIKKSNLKFKDLIKFKCAICGRAFTSWATGHTHYVKQHKCKPFLFCLCGNEIRSKSAVNSHFREHKQENLLLRQKMGLDLESDEIEKCAKLRVADFVRFICKTCKEEFTSWYSLMDHTEQTHQQKAVVQCKCGLMLRSKSLLYKHINDHKNPDLLKCEKCPRIAKSLSALEKHMRLKHVPKTEKCFACVSCHKAFHTKELLKSHEKSHLPIEERKVFSCNVCDMRFTTKSSAASHKRIIHDKVKKYVCDLCGFSCGTGGELRQHRAIHSDDKPFKCDTCSKTFKTYSNLKTHKDTHENTSYSCFVCYRVLNSRRTLRKHLLVHEDKLRHVCSYCNKGFKRRQTLKVHMCTHTGDKPLSCKWCDERFSYASTLRSHRLRCHPDKMAANTQTTQNNLYVYQDNIQPEYDKNMVMDQETLNIAKNEVEAM